jgi:hypothetical protein
MNPLFQQMQQGGGNSLLQQFMNFKKNFKGNPQEQVQQLLNSGKITQEQYDQAVKMAQQFQRMLNG